MPLYEYKCEKCGQHFEVLEKFSDDPLKTHEICGGPVHRLLSAPALQFKGSGWYITDYAKGNAAKSSENGAAKKSDTSSAATSGDSGSSASSTKAETKSSPAEPRQNY